MELLKNKLLTSGKNFLLGLYCLLVVVLKKIGWAVFWLTCFYLFIFVFN
jgi:hypothetical protein